MYYNPLSVYPVYCIETLGAFFLFQVIKSVSSLKNHAVYVFLPDFQSFLLECVIVFVNAEKLLIASITFLASAFGKDWILLIVIASVITLYNIVRFRQMSNLFTTLFQDIAIKKTHGNKSRVFECLLLNSIEKCFLFCKKWSWKIFITVVW